MGCCYINGFSILFKGGKAYFGGSLDTEEEILALYKKNNQGGVDCTVDGGTITFFDTKTGKSVVCAYSGTTITDTNGYLSSGYTGYVYRRSR